MLWKSATPPRKMEAVWLTSTALPREKESIMIQVTDGHCGMCVHFGEHDTQHQEQLVEIRDTKVAPEDLVEECGHPKLESLHLEVTAAASCDGYEPAKR
jgi:hypothetical protein